MGGRTKQLNRRAKNLSLKEKRLRRQAAFLSGAKDILAESEQSGYARGHAAGRAEALAEVDALTREHKRMTHFVAELRKLMAP